MLAVVLTQLAALPEEDPPAQSVPALGHVYHRRHSLVGLVVRDLQHIQGLEGLP
jgi:hypothetical protein